MYKHNDVKICHRCGRLLEIGETCNCPYSRGSPKDGLRALCPAFIARSCYRGKYYISCSCGKFRFKGHSDRNDYYRDHCCGDWLHCEIYKNNEGENENERAQRNGGSNLE